MGVNVWYIPVIKKYLLVYKVEEHFTTLVFLQREPYKCNTSAIRPHLLVFWTNSMYIYWIEPLFGISRRIWKLQNWTKTLLSINLCTVWFMSNCTDNCLLSADMSWNVLINALDGYCYHLSSSTSTTLLQQFCKLFVTQTLL